MAVHNGLVLLQIILLLWTVESASEPLSCPDRCGNVLIEYPFGIGAGCYFDESFEVVCDNSSGSPKAILQKIGQEISSYTSYSGSPNIAVNISVTSLSSINNVKGINLTGTPFSFSQRINKFLAIGCDNYANNQQNDSISSNSILTDAGGECISICTCNPSENSDCCDIVCNIPQNSSTKVLDANTSYVYSQSIPKGCTSLSLVDPDWIFSNYLKTPSGLKDKKKIPAVLEWGKYKGVCYEDYNSHTKVCNKDDRCLIQLSSGHFCRCDYSRNSVYQDYFCEGDLICNTTSGHNCSKCPDGYNYYRPAYYRPLQERRCSPKRSRDSFFSKKTRVKYVVIGCTSGGLGMFLLIGAWWLFKFVKRRREIKLKRKFFKRNGGLLLQQELASTEGTIEKTKLFTSKELERATDNFNLNRILGQGGQGTVYKGMLPDGKIVAVKKSKVIDESKVEEFINEMVILSQINHRNVVKLLGCCLETEVPLLVYEFIPNGTLFQYIHDQNEDFPITWEMRLRIAIEVSGALSYLHSAASIPIYHRDIKSTNILLDDKYRAKVSDFGASRSMAVDQTHMTTQVHGTFGYLDPEYFRSSQFTDKSDVYSFGVVLAELLTGEKPIRFTTLEEDKSLAAYFLCAMKEERLFEILDARVMKEGDGDEIIIFAKVAKRCLNLNGKKRPTMREVASELAGIKAWNGASNVIEEDLEEIDCALGDIYIVANSETDGSINGSFLDDVTISMDANPLIKSNW